MALAHCPPLILTESLNLNVCPERTDRSKSIILAAVRTHAASLSSHMKTRGPAQRYSGDERDEMNFPVVEEQNEPGASARRPGFRCSHVNCNRAFYRKEHLARHERSRHARVSPYACHICQRGFGRTYVTSPSPRPCRSFRSRSVS